MNWEDVEVSPEKDRGLHPLFPASAAEEPPPGEAGQTLFEFGLTFAVQDGEGSVIAERRVTHKALASFDLMPTEVVISTAIVQLWEPWADGVTVGSYVVQTAPQGPG